MQPTRRLYLEDEHGFEATGIVLATREDAMALDQTCFFPGGGGQPPDQGAIRFPTGEIFQVVSVRADADDVLWHITPSTLPPSLWGLSAELILDKERRAGLSRHHTALHVLNTIALREYGAWITGVQIGVEYSRIDFKVEGFSPAMCAELESRVNVVLANGHALKSCSMPEEKFRGRGDLLRTLEAQPPVVQGRVRVVEIEGFDAQACGGTHVKNTSEVGRLSIFRTENKGRINKRLYVRLDPAQTESSSG
jgi:misacylated tRNA(Ala) deacylase